MKTTTQKTPTSVEQRVAHALADADVWPSAFQKTLEEMGFSVLTSRELNELLDSSHDGSPDVLILAKRNAMFAVRACRAIRGLRNVPTIVVISDGSDFVPVMDAGADDAVTSSSDPAVFSARLRALMRRARHWQSERSGGIIAVRDLLVDLDKCHVVLKGHKVNLTPTEFRILAVLAEKAGKVVDARTLLSSVHEHDYGDREAQSLVKVHIANLRRKLKDGRGGDAYILCVRSFGYMLERRSVRRHDDPLLALLDATSSE